MNAEAKIKINEKADSVAWARDLPDDAALAPPDAEKFLCAFGPPIKRSTLDTWRCRRSDGPVFLRRHGRISYRVGDLRAYLGLAQSHAA